MADSDTNTYLDNLPQDPVRQAQLVEFARERAADPRAYFSRLRAKCPVDFDEGVYGVVQALKRSDVERVLRDTDVFSNVMGLMGSDEPVIPLGVDPPQHAQYRRLLDPLFSPRRMALLEPAVTAHVNTLIDGIIDRGECDFSADVAVPLPCSTFLSLLGLPQEDLPQLNRWKDIMIRPDQVAGSMEAGVKLQAETAVIIYQRFADEMAIRRAEPRDDLISFLLTAEVDNHRLTDSEIQRTLLLMLSAGLDTVTISLQCIISHLAQHPQDRDVLLTEPDKLDSIIEELMRWETPVAGATPRRATRDTELSGCPIPAGTLVMPMLGAADLDPDFEGTLRLDLRRGDKRHLAFGGGPHRCLGSHLARMELRTVVREWHRRIPNYRVKPGVTLEWNGSALRGIDYLPLVWDVTGKAGE
ncbi:cytochrome P450 [Parafrankia sp. FMc2]|uniref:cytochrome P450 n=1 Tax=Parafrankia sp. FMc2 TaxID=3233196 RepID=UPI0034D3AD82